MFGALRWIWTLGLVFCELFILCVFWNVVDPSPSQILTLETVFPCFKWLSTGHFILGALESFFYGAGAAVTVVLIRNSLLRKHAQRAVESQNRKAA